MPVSTRSGNRSTTRSSTQLSARWRKSDDADAKRPPHQSTPSSSSDSTPLPARKRSKVAVAVTPEPGPESSPTSNNNKKATRTKKKTAPSRQKGAPAKKTAAPEGWRDVYDLVIELRQDRTAPCDHSGAEGLIDTSQSPQNCRFQALIALMLSSQTKDAIVGEAVRNMQADNVLDVTAISSMSAEQLHSYIRRVGFHNNKTKYIKQVVDILLETYDGDIPPTAAQMMELPGVGPKMAYILENIAWQEQTGIGIDTHMHRLFNALHWVNHTKTPEQTRLQMQAWLPHELWADVNLLWVGFGQEVQQFPAKVLRKALDCSRPRDALRLLKRCGLDYRKEGKKAGLEEEIEKVLKSES